MAEKVEFKRNVNNAVMGDFNEAPRLSNVVTLHVGDKEKDIELITSYQRSNIKSLVDKLASLTGDEEIKIYRGLITDYGLQKFKELPRSKYQEVKAILERRIDEASIPVVVPTAFHPVSESKLVADHQSQTVLSCLACTEKSLSFSRLQRTARFQLAALITCLIICGWLLYKIQPSIVHSSDLKKEDKCYIAGKAYSIGYVERSRNGAMECVRPVGEISSKWMKI